MSWTINSDFKCCATCRKWCGQRQPRDPWANTFELFSSQEKGKCQGGGFNQAQTIATAQCQKWEPRFSKY